MEDELDRDIGMFDDCFERLEKIGDENLSLFINTLQKGNLDMIKTLFNKYINKYDQMNSNLGKEYELGAAQARYENDEYWINKLKEERANCIYSAGSYDIDTANTQQHKYIGGFEAINRILKDM